MRVYLSAVEKKAAAAVAKARFDDDLSKMFRELFISHLLARGPDAVREALLREMVVRKQALEGSGQ